MKFPEDIVEKAWERAKVTVAGLGHSVTNRKGYAKLYIPYDFTYSLTIRYDKHEEVLYEENISPRKTYIYRAELHSNPRELALTLNPSLLLSLLIYGSQMVEETDLVIAPLE